MSSPWARTQASASCAGVAPFSVGQLLDLGGQLEVRLQVLAGEPRPVAAEVVGVELVRRLEPAGEEAAAERRVRDQADPELPQGRQDLRLEVAGPERVLRLHRRDRMGGVRLADPLRRRLAEPDVEDLALLDQLGHRPDRLLDRHVRVHAVLVVEIDPVGPEALERALDRAAHVLGRAVAHPRPSARLVALRADAELGRDHPVVSMSGDRLADQLLVLERPVHLGRVEEVDPQIERLADRRDCLVLVGGAVEGRHAHASESERGDLESPIAQRSLLHLGSFRGFSSSTTHARRALSQEGLTISEVADETGLSNHTLRYKLGLYRERCGG